MKKSRAKVHQPPSETSARHGATSRKVPRRQPIKPSRKPRPRAPNTSATCVVSRKDSAQPRTTLPKVRRDSCLSTAAESSVSNLHLIGGENGGTLHSEQVLSAAASLWRSRELHDIILAVEHHRIGAHRLILAVCSGYFRELFTGEEREDREDLVYTLHGISYEALKVLLESMYTSHLHVTYDNIEELLNAALYLKVSVALKTCKDFLLLNLCAETSLRTLSVAHRFELPEIVEQALQVAAFNFIQVANNREQFHELGEDPLKLLLRRDDLRIESELEVFKVAKSWIDHRVDTLSNSSVVSIMSLVRLPMIPPEELVDHVESVGYLMKIPEYEDLVKEALHYYCLPLRQSVLQSIRTTPRSVSSLKTVVSFGGQPRKARDGVSDDMRYFDINTKEWKLFGKLPEPRHHHSVSVLGGFLYMVGGRQTVNTPDPPLSTAYRYDPRTDSWVQIASMIQARESFEVCVLNNKIYAIGGRVDDKQSLASVERYDPLRNAWEEVAPLAEPKRCVAATAHGNLLFAMGGSGNGKISSRVECYDDRSNEWKTRRSLQFPRIFGMLTPYRDHIYLAGGATVDDSGSLRCVSQIEKYHPPSDTWVTLSNMIISRAEASCAIVNGRIYFVGGYNWDTKSWVQTVEAYDVEEDSWEETGNFPNAYTGLACCGLTLHRLP